MSFNAVVQAVLIFGVEESLMTPHMVRYLGGVQHRVARGFTRRQTQILLDRSLGYPPLETEMHEAGLKRWRNIFLRG